MNLSLCKNLISLSLKNPPHLFNNPNFSSSLSTFYFCSLPRTSKPIFVFDYLTNRHGFSPRTAIKVSAVLTSIKSPEKSDLLLNYLKKSGFSITHLEKIVQQVPGVLSSNLEKTIGPKIELFQELGFTQEDLADIIASDPWILTRSKDKRLFPSIVLLKSVLGSSSNVCKVLKLSGWFLKRDLAKTMIPNIEFMMSCGISRSQITKFVFNFPRFFVLKTENIKELVKRVDKLGFDRNSKMFIHAIRTLSSMTEENWELKLDLFRSLGLSQDDVLIMFRRVPQVFAVSQRKIREGAEFLITSGKCGASYIALHPELLIYSLEGRIKPRTQVLEILERKNLVSGSFSLTSVLKMTDSKFFEKFVFPYQNEVGNIFIAKEAL